jgi:hypothetical protein
LHAFFSALADDIVFFFGPWSFHQSRGNNLSAEIISLNVAMTVDTQCFTLCQRSRHCAALRSPPNQFFAIAGQLSEPATVVL